MPLTDKIITVNTDRQTTMDMLDNSYIQIYILEEIRRKITETIKVIGN